MVSSDRVISCMIQCVYEVHIHLIAFNICIGMQLVAFCFNKRIIMLRYFLKILSPNLYLNVYFALYIKACSDDIFQPSRLSQRFFNILRKAAMMRLWKLICFLRSLGRISARIFCNVTTTSCLLARRTMNAKKNFASGTDMKPAFNKMVHRCFIDNSMNLRNKELYFTTVFSYLYFVSDPVFLLETVTL